MWWLLRRRFGHRLYLQIYVTVVASLALVVVAAGLVWHTVQGGVTNEIGTIAGEVAAAALPSEAGATRQQEVLTRLATRLNADLALFDAAGQSVAAANVTDRGTLALPDFREHGWRNRG